jgi:4'-phosphopantetheinyl transferase
MQASDSIWESPPAQPSLTSNSVQLWRATAEIPVRKIAEFQKLLSVDEKARADRFRFERDRHRFVVARVVLRSILSRYLGCKLTELEFKYSAYGKPFLAGPHADPDLSFNMAHSGTLALYAITLGRAIGVDVERIREDFDTEEIARQFFSANEVSQLLSLHATARAKGFFDCWTRKEAFIKAKGIGLSLPLDQFDVSLCPDEPALLLETRWDMNECARWSLKAIDADPEYAAAVAVEGRDWQSSYWQVSDEMALN